MREYLNQPNKGITLIALIITIIILLILTGVSIKLLLGEKGLISKSELAVNEYKNSIAKENEQFNEMINIMNKQEGMQNGESENTNRKYIFNDGEVSDVLLYGSQIDGDSGGHGEYNISNVLECTVYSLWCRYRVRNQEAIDLTNYTKAIFVVDSVNAEGSYAVMSIGVVGNKVVSKALPTKNDKTTYEIDISEITGDGYVYVEACNGGPIIVSKIYLE